MKRFKAAYLCFICLMLLAAFSGFAPPPPAAGPPVMATLVKESNTTLRLYFNEPVTVTGTYNNEFALIDCKGNSFAVSAIADDVPNDSQIILTTDDLSTAQGDLTLTFFNQNNPILDLDNTPLDTDGIGVSLLAESKFDISQAVYESKSYTVAENTLSRTFALNNDGSKIFILGTTGDNTVYEYDLSTPYEIGSISYTGRSLNIEAQDSNPLHLTFNPTGSKMYMVGITNKSIYEYDLTTNFDLSSASFTTSYAIPGETLPTCMEFNQDGTKVYLMGALFDFIYEFTLSAPFNLSSLPQNNSFATGSFDTNHNIAVSFTFNHDGTKLYTVDRNIRRVYQYSLSTPYDLATMTLDHNQHIGSTTGEVGTFSFSEDGSEFYAVGTASNTVYQFSLSDNDAPKLDQIQLKSSTEIDVLFDETVEVLGSNPSNFSVLKDGVALTVDQISDPNPGDQAVTLTLNASTTLAGVTSTVQVTYADAGGNGEISDAECNPVEDDAIGITLAIETQAPGLISASIQDSQTIILNFDEAIQTTGNNASNFTITDCRAITYSAQAIKDNIIGDNILELLVDDLTFRSGELTIDYTDPGNQAIFDGGLNPLANTVNVIYQDSWFNISEGVFAGTAGEFAISLPSPDLPTGFTVDESGTSLFVVSNDENIYKFNLATPFEVSTATQVGLPVAISGYTDLRNPVFNDSGSKLYMIGTNGVKGLLQFDLTTNFDITTLSVTPDFISISEDTNPAALEFSTSGDKLYVLGRVTNSVFEYDLSTTFDITSNSYTGSSFVVGTSQPFSLNFTPDGSRMFVFGFASKELREFTLDTKFDISTAVFNGTGEALSVASDITFPFAVAFDSEGTRTYVFESNSVDKIHVYRHGDATAPTMSAFSKNSSTEVTIIFSENVNSYGLFPTSFTVSDGATLYSPTAIVDAVEGDNILQLIFGSPIASSSELTIIYNNGSGNNEIADFNCNVMASDPTGITINLETVPPQLSFAQEESSTEIILYFNEPVQLGSGISGSNFVLTDCDATTYLVNTVTDGTLNDNIITLSVDDLTGANGELSLQITTNNGEISDLSGNTIAGNSLNYLLADNFNFASANFLGASEQFNMTAQDTYPLAMAFDNQGLNMFMVGLDNKRIYRYQLSVPYDVSSAVLTADNLDVSTQFDTPLQIGFDPTGTKMHMVGVPPQGQLTYISQYSLSTPYDITTASFSGSYDSGTTDGEDIPTSMNFNADGSKMLILGTRLDAILQYSLSTNYDISTATFLGNGQTLDVLTPSGGSATSFIFDNSGNFMYLLSNNLGLISEYFLEVPFDVLTASLNSSSQTFTITEDANPRTLAFNDDGSTAFVLGAEFDNVYEFELVDLSGPTMLGATQVNSTTIELTFNEPVKAAGAFPGDFSVTDLVGLGNAFAVTAIIDATPEDEILTLTVSDLSTASGDIQITYNSINNEISDLNCNDMVSDPSGVDIDLDMAAPTMVSAVVDNSTQVSITFSEPVQTNGGNPTDFLVTDGAGNTYNVIAQSDGIAQDAVIVLTTDDLSGILGDLAITYNNNNQEIIDFGNNELATDTQGIVIDLDQTVPTFTGATLDGGGSFLLLAFSEAVQSSGSGISDFSLVDGVGTSFGLASLFDSTPLDTELELSLSASTGAAIGDLFLTYVNSSDQIGDFGDNALQSTVNDIAIDIDQTAPTLTGVAKSSDTELLLTFSESVQTSGSNANDFEVVDDQGTSIQVTNIADGTAQDDQLTLTVSSLSVVNNDITVTFIGGNNVVSDFGSNELATDNVGVNFDIVAPATPAITGIADDNGPSNSDGITNDTNLLVNGTAEANSAVELFFFNGNTTNLTAMADGAGSFIVDLTSTLAAGTYPLSVRATDAAGNVSAESQAFTVTIDTDVPIVQSFIRNASGKLGASVTTAEFAVSFSEPVSGIDPTDFEVVLTGTATGQVGTVTVVSVNEAIVEVIGVSGEGTIGLNLKDDDSIEDTAGNALGGAGLVNGDFTGEVYETKASQTITFADPSGAYGEVITLSATSSSGLLVGYALISGPATLSGGQLTITGVGTIEVEASQAGDADFNPAVAIVKTFTSSKASLAVVADDKSITFGDALPGLTISYSGFVGTDASTDLDAVPSISTTATASSDAGTYPITLSGGSDDQYSYGFQDGTLTINQASQVLTFDAINDIDLASINTVNLVATSSAGLSVGFSLTQGDGTISGSTLTANTTGIFTVEASQTGSTNYSAAVPVSQTFNVNDSRKTDQTITFSALTDKVYGDASFPISASASSSLPVTFSVIGPVTLSGSDLTITGAGLVTVTASQAGDGTFNPATSVDQSFVVGTATLTVTPDDQQISFGDAIPTLTFSYDGFVGSDAITDLDSEPTSSTLASATSDVGTYDIVASGGSDDNYTYSYQTGTLTIIKADQAITFDPIANIDLATSSTVDLVATASSGLDVVYALISGDGAISSNVLMINATGNFTIEATQTGNNNFNAATAAAQSFQATDSRKLDQTITFGAIGDQVYGDQLSLTATASSNLGILYDLTAGAGTITNNVLSIEGVGSYSITASQVGDNDFNPAMDVVQSFVVAKADLTVTADDQIIEEGNAIPTLTATYSGFKLTDDITSVDTEPSLGTIATDQSVAGTYAITLTGGDDNHYNLGLVSGTLTITEVLGFENDPLIEVYPNPTSDGITVKGDRVASIQLIDLGGKTVLSTNQRQLDLSPFSSGTYQIVVKDVYGLVLTKRKVIKN